ncbi:hypothetical protein SO802_014022 [Lithocarpus litseifolius]|uniref:Uncharacterized protein n=1 Tax=Lithocarpus litseifolius TaxID=425828 RepID=A0AAW2D7Y0_9ROSI
MDPQVFRNASSSDSTFFEKLTPNSDTLLQVTIEKNTVLHVALQFKNFEAAKKIVNLSPSLVYQTNSKGNTPLHVAARIGDFSMVKLLIDQAKKQDVEKGGRQHLLSMVNLDGDTALHVAVRYGNSKVVKELINEKDPAKLAKQVNNVGESALFLAVYRQDYDMASCILSDAPDCSYAGRLGVNVLHALAIHKRTRVNTAATRVMERFKIETKKLKIFASVFIRPLDVEKVRKLCSLGMFATPDGGSTDDEMRATPDGGRRATPGGGRRATPGGGRNTRITQRGK